MFEAITAALAQLVMSYPILSGVLSFLYLVKVAAPYVQSMITAIVKATPSQEDDKMWNQIQGSWIYKVIWYIIDATTSIKLKVK